MKLGYFVACGYDKIPYRSSVPQGYLIMTDGVAYDKLICR